MCDNQSNIIDEGAVSVGQLWVDVLRVILVAVGWSWFTQLPPKTFDGICFAFYGSECFRQCVALGNCSPGIADYRWHQPRLRSCREYHHFHCDVLVIASSTLSRHPAVSVSYYAIQATADALFLGLMECLKTLLCCSLAVAWYSCRFTPCQSLQPNYIYIGQHHPTGILYHSTWISSKHSFITHLYSSLLHQGNHTG